MIGVQFDDVNKTQMCIDVFYVVVCQKSFWNVVDQFNEGYDGKLLFFYYVEVPFLNDKGLQFQLILSDDLWVLLCEVLKSLDFFSNSQLQFNLGGL